MTDDSVNPGINHPLVKDAIKRCADLMADLSNGLDVAESAWSAARSAAESSAWQKIADKLIKLLEVAPVGVAA